MNSINNETRISWRGNVRRKLLILCAVFLGLVIILSGCKKSQKNPNEVTDFLKDLDSYSTDFIMEVKNDKQTIAYEGKQFYNKDLGYRLELGEDRVFIYKSDKIYVNDIKNNVKYTTDKDFDSTYKLSFINEYIMLLYTNEDIKYDFKDIEGKKYQLINLTIPGGNKEISKAVMYVDTKSYLPEWVIIYDEKDQERVKITYKNFQVSPDMKPDLFKVED